MSANKTSSAEVPALVGGNPVRPQGPPDWPLDDPAVAEALHKSAADGSWGKYHGPYCEEFSARLAEYHACERVVLCSSGTAAVELALRGLKVNIGDEVILAAYDFKGNFQNVVTVGATPVLVDIHPQNWNLDVSRLEAAVGASTKAIIVSHLHGGIVPMAAVMEIARKHKIAVIEDACQMPGAIVEGKTAGTWGDVGVLSFGGSKLLSAGRGGALLTDNAELVQRARLYSHRGNEAYPLSELQAAVLVPQLQQLNERNALRSANVALLCEKLSADSGLTPFRNSTPEVHHSSRATQPSTPGFYKLGFQYDPNAFGGMSRELFSRAMHAEGIAVDPGFRALHKIHSVRRYKSAGELPNAERADERVLTLHHPVLLEGESEIEEIVTAVEKIRHHAEMILDSQIQR